MSDYGTDASLQVSIYLEHDVDMDDDGLSYLVTNVFVGEQDDAQEVRVPIDIIVESLCDIYGDIDGYQHLYVVAHELSRAAEELREKAGFIEDSVTAMSDLFDGDDD